MNHPPDIAIAISYLRYQIPDLEIRERGNHVEVIGTSLQILSHWTKIPESRIEGQSDGYRIGISDLYEMQSRGHYGDRSDLPSLRLVDGSRYWHRDGKLHREGGPAIEKINGDRLWYRNGQRHREDGPAVEWKDGDLEWYRNGERCDPPT